MQSKIPCQTGKSSGKRFRRDRVCAISLVTRFGGMDEKVEV
jgi:hypothetical protein